jgi:hypothetical protein
MTTVTSDFVQVQLTAAGIAMAGTDGSVRIANGHFSYVFTAGNAVRVLSSEWRRVLSLKLYQGQAILEIAPVATVAATKTSASSTRVVSPVASHTDAPTQSAASTSSAAEAEVK